MRSKASKANKANKHKEKVMGVDVTAYTMYGKEFDSFSDAADFLVAKGVLTEDEADEAKNDGEFYECHGKLRHLDYQTYSCYVENGGILGVQITVREALEKHSEVCNWMDDSFCQWH